MEQRNCQLANDVWEEHGIAMPVQQAIDRLVDSISFVNFATLDSWSVVGGTVPPCHCD